VDEAYTTSPSDLPSLPERGKIILPLDHLPPEEVPRDIPPALMIRFEDLINETHQKRLELRWDAVIASHPKRLIKCDKNRSTSEGYHFGIWEVCSAQPRVTKETSAQSSEATEAIHNLLQYLGDFVAPRIANVFKQHAPDQWLGMER